jgi:hypothetical protein
MLSKIARIDVMEPARHPHEIRNSWTVEVGSGAENEPALAGCAGGAR